MPFIDTERCKLLIVVAASAFHSDETAPIPHSIPRIHHIHERVTILQDDDRKERSQRSLPIPLSRYLLFSKNPKTQRKVVEGVLFAEKNYQLEKHPEIEVRNLYVIKLMQSFKSRELVKERFAWRHYYWFLTPKGVEYLREYLNLPEDIVPATHKQRTRGDRPGGPPRRFEDRGPPPEGRGDFRGGYREGPSATEKVGLRKIHIPTNTDMTIMSCRKEQEETINRDTSVLASDVVADSLSLLRDEIRPLWIHFNSMALLCVTEMTV